ncbi:hypothetical protein NM208_g12468 [Fusarium decemcellulare]|uniref:Uncharacterized protein n=1 Tax=Fusarium decemcellulare TaxID=57161 RepID=A0ACC1RPV0_9HYPO|nr:hypothetical protein NM208_g12468 [Fusarium decemcellulare]
MVGGARWRGPSNMPVQVAQPCHFRQYFCDMGQDVGFPLVLAVLATAYPERPDCGKLVEASDEMEAVEHMLAVVEVDMYILVLNVAGLLVQVRAQTRHGRHVAGAEVMQKREDTPHDEIGQLSHAWPRDV